MEAIQFVYWLQGALELGQRKELSEEQVKIIQDHLNLVLKKVTPQYGIQTSPGVTIPSPFPAHPTGIRSQLTVWFAND